MRHICGGCVLGSRYVLTTAHCLFRENGSALYTDRLRILAGRHELTSSNKKGFFTGINKTYVHEKHNETINDIAILRVRFYYLNKINSVT